jgi:hypothetical protein
MFGLGVYPTRNVIDGWLIRCDSQSQRNLRFSTELDSSDWRTVGPLSVQLIEPLQQWRLRIADNATGVHGDLVWKARSAAWETERIHLVAPSGDASDFSHYFQPGSYSGQLSLDGENVDVDGWLGTRDRSRGVRLVTEGGGLHLWVQAQFTDRSIAFLYNEDRGHHVTHCDGAVLHVDGSADPVVGVEHNFTFDDELDFRTGTMTVHTISGQRIDLTVDGTYGGGFLSGGGYGGGHGEPRGLNWSDGERWALDGTVTPRTLDVPLTDRPARFIDQAGAIGAGVFEFAVTRSPRYTYRPVSAASG